MNSCQVTAAMGPYSGAVSVGIWLVVLMALMSLSVWRSGDNKPLLVATVAGTLAISGYGCMWTMQSFNAIQYTSSMGAANGALVVFLLTLLIGYASWALSKGNDQQALITGCVTSAVIGTGALFAQCATTVGVAAGWNVLFGFLIGIPVLILLYKKTCSS